MRTAVLPSEPLPVSLPPSHLTPAVPPQTPCTNHVHPSIQQTPTKYRTGAHVPESTRAMVWFDGGGRKRDTNDERVFFF